MKANLALVVVALVVSAGGTPAEVRVSADSIRVQAAGQPLAEVLAQLSKAASFEVKYEGATPSVRVYATIEGHSVPETIARLLEGTGVTWAARFDPSGTRIELLVVGGLVQSAPAGSSPAGGRDRSSSRPVVEAPPPEPMEEVAEPPMMMEPPPDPEPPPPPAQPASAPSMPGASPFSSGFGSSLPRFGGSAPANPGSAWSQPGSTWQQPGTPQTPQIPSGASMPQL